MLKSPKTNTLAEGLVEIKTLNMLDETAPKTVHKKTIIDKETESF